MLDTVKSTAPAIYRLYKVRSAVPRLIPNELLKALRFASNMFELPNPEQRYSTDCLF